MNAPEFPRRDFLKLGMAALPLLSLSPASVMAAARGKAEFQLACMTLPYAPFPLERTSSGIQSAGYKLVGWGTTHKDADGRSLRGMAADAAPHKAKQLGNRCGEVGLTPLMMYSGIHPEAKDAVAVFTSGMRQAA